MWIFLVTLLTSIKAENNAKSYGGYETNATAKF